MIDLIEYISNVRGANYEESLMSIFKNQNFIYINKLINLLLRTHLSLSYTNAQTNQLDPSQLTNNELRKQISRTK